MAASLMGTSTLDFGIHRSEPGSDSATLSSVDLIKTEALITMKANSSYAGNVNGGGAWGGRGTESGWAALKGGPWAPAGPLPRALATLLFQLQQPCLGVPPGATVSSQPPRGLLFPDTVATLSQSPGHIAPGVNNWPAQSDGEGSAGAGKRGLDLYPQAPICSFADPDPFVGVIWGHFGGIFGGCGPG